MEFSGERLGYSDRHSDLRDCAEIKIPVVEEFTRSGQSRGPSHRLTYREFEGPEPGHLPVRQVVAFEPRRDGRPFDVTADRLGRSKGVPLAELNSIQTVRPASGPGKDAGRPVGPDRRPLPPDLAQAKRALEGNAPASGAVNAPRSDNNRPRPKGASPEGPFKGR